MKIVSAVILGASAAALAQAPTFGPPIPSGLTGTRANGFMEFADANGDQVLDAVMSDLITRDITTMLGAGAGVFGPPVVTPLDPNRFDWEPAFALGDFNEDGRADIVLALMVPFGPSPNTPNLVVKFGQPDGTFAGEVALRNSEMEADFAPRLTDRGIAVADVTGDGNLDIITPTNNYPLFTDPQLSVLPGDGTGGFGAPILSGFCLISCDITLIGDINGDQKPDCVQVVNTGSQSHAKSNARVNLGDGAGHFTFTDLLTFDARLDSGSGPARAYLRDLDHDGSDDLLVFGRPGAQSGAGGVYVERSNRDGTFTRVFRVGGSAQHSAITLADFDADAAADFVIHPQGGPGIVYRNNGDATFTQAGAFPELEGAFEYRDTAAINLLGSPLPDVATLAVADIPGEARLYVIENTTPASPHCYADCNGDAALNLADFGCFQTRFALADPRADCNADTILNLADFGCFTTKFALGCP